MYKMPQEMGLIAIAIQQIQGKGKLIQLLSEGRKGIMQYYS